jgi:hypothetical protein
MLSCSINDFGNSKKGDSIVSSMVSFSGLENEHSDLCEKKKPAMVSYVGWLLQGSGCGVGNKEMLEDKASRVSHD